MRSRRICDMGAYNVKAGHGPLSLVQTKTPAGAGVFVCNKSLAMTYFHMANATLSSARSGFTSEFGKGSGGSHSLWSPGNPGGSHCLLGNTSKFIERRVLFKSLNQALIIADLLPLIRTQTTWVLYGQASRAISIR